jgi:hypothetical protein
MSPTGASRSLTKFKDELRKYPWPRSSAIRAHLQRWLDDERADDVWKAVSKAAGANLGTEEFIRFVASTAMSSRALPVRIKTYKREAGAALSGYGARVAEAFGSNKSLGEIAELLEEVAWQLRFRERVAMLDRYPAGAISRRQKGDSQQRRAFSLSMSDFFEERCGKWMDDEAGVLLEIAFGPKGDDISQEVRDYRKSRAKKAGD